MSKSGATHLDAVHRYAPETKRRGRNPQVAQSESTVSHP